MQYPKLDAQLTKYPRLARLSSKFEAFLLEQRELAEDEPYEMYVNTQSSEIGTEMVSQALGINETDALTLLYLAEQVGILVHSYQVYCPETGRWLGEYKDKNQLPEVINCNFHGIPATHSIDEYGVLVAFHFSHEVYEKHMQYA